VTQGSTFSEFERILDTFIFVGIYATKEEAVEIAETMYRDYPIDDDIVRVWIGDEPLVPLDRDDVMVNPG
jgi:exo-beta-1,3-glucanase (GH17 family)